MRVQDYIADSARDAAEMAFRYAKATPAKRLEWAPEGGRSTIDICRELAMTPSWTLYAFGVSDEQWSEEAAEATRREQASWTTVEACEAEFKKRFAALDTFFRGLSDADLAKTKWLPYNGGRDHTFLEMMDYPRWNCTYHLGQIGYLQTLLGDTDEH